MQGRAVFDAYGEVCRSLFLFVLLDETLDQRAVNSIASAPAQFQTGRLRQFRPEDSGLLAPRLCQSTHSRPKDAQYYNELLIEQSGLTRSVSNDGAEDYQVTLQENGYDGQPSKSSSLPPLRSG